VTALTAANVTNPLELESEFHLLEFPASRRVATEASRTLKKEKKKKKKRKQRGDENKKQEQISLI
jgi:CelD/BcsL family acetyltransferase involved in cellulose biosynthesis